jgi:hypothetical protein
VTSTATTTFAFVGQTTELEQTSTAVVTALGAAVRPPLNGARPTSYPDKLAVLRGSQADAEARRQSSPSLTRRSTSIGPEYDLSNFFRCRAQA